MEIARTTAVVMPVRASMNARDALNQKLGKAVETRGGLRRPPASMTMPSSHEVDIQLTALAVASVDDTGLMENTG